MAGRRARLWVRRVTVGVLAAPVTLAMVQAVPAAGSPLATAAAVPAALGTAGLFTLVQGRVLDTRDGTGGYSTPMPAGVWRTVPVAGVADIPSQGVSAVQVTLIAVNPASNGYVSVTAAGGSGTATTALNYRSPASGTVTGSTIVPVDPASGGIQALASSGINLVIDVQGYYTAGDGTPAPGGYVPVAPTRVCQAYTYRTGHMSPGSTVR